MAAPPALRPRYLAPGDKLGKFELIRQIAVGGMAELYLARTMGIEGFEKLVVVKRILPQYVDNPSFVSMFLNEARLSATLHHPNIAQVYDIGVEDGDYFFSMEYIHGEDLGRLSVTALENGVPLSLDAALTLVAGLCAGLHYAHEKAGPDGTPLNVVHRDVSPSNVLVSYDGGVKLVDFGIARAGSQPSSTKGGLKGKIAYMSPEQCRGKATLDRRSDIFSVGTLLYELTTGQLPFTDESEYGVLSQIVNTDAPPPSSLVPSYPPALEAIVMRALSRDPDQRYATAVELQGHIEDFAHENRLRVSPLVLVRVMSTLFPARLEEWDTARAQGGFFVEQHVVQTLIESGKTSDDTAVGAAQAQDAPAPDEETTSVTAVAVPPARPDDEETRTFTSPPVMLAAPPQPRVVPARAPTPAPVSARAPTPVPPPPALSFPPAPVTATPGEVRILAAGPGAPSSNPRVDSAPIAMAPGIDVTGRVRALAPPPGHDETAFVRPPRRSRLPLFLATAAAIGVIAAIAIVVSGGGTSTDPAEAREAIAPATGDEVAAPAPIAEPVIDPPEAAPIELPADEPPAPAAPPPAVEPSPKRSRPPRMRPARKTAAEVKTPPNADLEPKEPAWNDNSPFMPVRTERR